ncbi:hypothetical protein EVAR_76646_1 [Eumeta japonica]|uniref:Uncharacterized protein n=1 Tax=Eumeta variegata TaxID=151549 RepID=A0A4C1T660_EUMVA|nr:hypothetical protein EVAR_76646_1 [Eumeta japonica]
MTRSGIGIDSRTESRIKTGTGREIGNGSEKERFWNHKNKLAGDSRDGCVPPHLQVATVFRNEIVASKARGGRKAVEASAGAAADRYILFYRCGRWASNFLGAITKSPAVTGRYLSPISRPTDRAGVIEAIRPTVRRP